MRPEEVILRYEAEGLRYLGTVSRFTTPDEQTQVDVWEQEVRARNGGLSAVIYKDAVYMFEEPNRHSGPPTSRTHIKAKASAA